jgi:hypothetical protein
MQKIVLAIILFVSLIGSVVAVDADPITQAKLLLDQYSSRVKFVESENAILREEMRKAGIKIPLSLFSGAIQTSAITGSTVVTNPTTVSVNQTGSVTSTSVAAMPPVASGEISYSYIEKTH